MAHRTQRAAAIQAAQANNAILTISNRKRCNSQASSQTVTSPRVRSEAWQSSPSYRTSPPPMEALLESAVLHEEAKRSSISMSLGGSHGALIGDDADGNMLQLYLPADVNDHGFSSHGIDPGSHSWSQRSNGSLPTHYDQSLYGHHYRGYSDVEHDSGLHVGLGGTLNLASDYHRQNTTSLHASKDAALTADLSNSISAPIADDSYEDSTDSDLPPEKRKLSAAFRPRGKKKRNKCTPEQLRSLEAFFDKNRNPTGRIRQELSRKLRMPERSVQVWFQNRRAKVKTLVRRGDAGHESKKRVVGRNGDQDSDESCDDSSNVGRKDNQESTPSVKALPTSALCVGTWRRVSPLICFFSRRLQSLTWYLTSESIGFKLEIPWTSIRTAYFDGPWTPSIAERAEGVRVPLGHLVIDLDRPPTFFMEVFRSSAGKGDKEGAHKTSWRQCEDFTEHRQATTNPRHILNGPYEELRDAVMALAQSNDVLVKMIEFRDQERRALGNIPMGSSSTAENFGLINTDGRSPSSGTQDMGFPLAESHVGAFEGNGALPPSGSLGVAPSAVAWNMFRSPSMKVDAGWEFDSPASIATSLSETSFESVQRYPISYHGGNWKDNFMEESPRSPLGASVELNGLRIDTAGISSFSPAMFGSRLDDGMSHHRVDTWDGGISFEAASGYIMSGDGILPPAVDLGTRSNGNDQHPLHASFPVPEQERPASAFSNVNNTSNVDSDKAGMELMLNGYGSSMPSHGSNQRRKLTTLDEDLFHGATPTARSMFSQASSTSAAPRASQIHPELIGQQHRQEVSDMDVQGRGRANTYRQPDFGVSKILLDNDSHQDLRDRIDTTDDEGKKYTPNRYGNKSSDVLSWTTTDGASCKAEPKGPGHAEPDASAKFAHPSAARLAKSSPLSTPESRSGGQFRP